MFLFLKGAVYILRLVNSTPDREMRWAALPEYTATASTFAVTVLEDLR